MSIQLQLCPFFHNVRQILCIVMCFRAERTGVREHQEHMRMCKMWCTVRKSLQQVKSA